MFFMFQRYPPREIIDWNVLNGRGSVTALQVWWLEPKNAGFPEESPISQGAIFRWTMFKLWEEICFSSQQGHPSHHSCDTSKTGRFWEDRAAWCARANAALPEDMFGCYLPADKVVIWRQAIMLCRYRWKLPQESSRTGCNFVGKRLPMN